MENFNHFFRLLFYTIVLGLWITTGTVEGATCATPEPPSTTTPTTTTTTTTTEAPPAQFLCPSPTDISPCTCNAETRAIDCRGLQVKQETLNRTFAAIRTVNNAPYPQWLELSTFNLYLTCLPTLDLSPLLNLRFSTWISFNTNTPITKIFGPPLTEGGRIETPSFGIFDFRYVSDAGFGDTLRYFVPSTMRSISLTLMLGMEGGQWPISDGSGQIEFLPGLASFTNLEKFSFQSSNVQFLAGGQFQRNTRLIELNLSGNNLAQIGQNALLIDPSEDTGDTSTRVIWLSTNQLNDSSFHSNTGLQTLKTPTTLWLGQNQFEFISAENFEPFLDSNLKNNVNFNVQPFTDHFICDLRMKWLRDRKAEFQNKAWGIYCQNDLWNTIFTTSLVQ